MKIADEVTIAGISTTNDDVQVTSGGNLDLDEAVTLGAGALFFFVLGNVTLTAPLMADGFGMLVSGNTTLNNSNNDVNTIAAANDGTTSYEDSDGLSVGSVNVNFLLASGILTSNDDVKLTIGGDLDIENDIDLGTGNLFLNVTDNLTQQLNATIAAAGLGLMVEGTTTLNEDNMVTTLAADNDDVISFNNATNLFVDTVSVDGMDVNGITTSNDDMKLSVDGVLAINEAIDVGTGDLLLDVSGDVLQSEPITADGLGLMVDGTTTLQKFGNDVNTFAAENDGTTLFADNDDLDRRHRHRVDGAAGEMIVTGIQTTNDNAKLQTAATWPSIQRLICKRRFVLCSERQRDPDRSDRGRWVWHDGQWQHDAE